MSLDVNREALELIQGTAVEAEAARVVQLDVDNPRERRVKIGNQLITVKTPPPPRRHEVRVLTDLIAYAIGADDGDQVLANPVVWHGPDRVVLLLDDLDRHDRVTFELDVSEEFQALLDINNRKTWLDQQQFIDLLRSTLGLDAEMIAPFRRLDWQQNAQATADLQHGKDQVGKQLRAEVTGQNSLPLQDELSFAVPVYRSFGERTPQTIVCDVLIDAQDRRLALRPQPGEIDTLMDTAQMSIRERLEKGLTGEVKVPIYYGSP